MLSTPMAFGYELGLILLDILKRIPKGARAGKGFEINTICIVVKILFGLDVKL